MMSRKEGSSGRVVSIYLPEPLADLIDRLAEKEELGNRSAVIKKLLLSALKARGETVRVT